MITGTTGPQELIKAADLLLRALPDPYVVDGHTMPITGKAGLAETTAADATPESLLRSAAIALGWAKNDNAGPVAVFDPDRSRTDIRRHELTAAMPGALDNGQFLLHYQPLVDLLDHRTVGVEALARWRLPVTGLIPPGQFIHLAEQTGLIHRLGLHLLETACARGAEWHPSGVFVSVNLSPVQLTDPGFVATVAAALDRTGLLPSRLQLELTESAALTGHHDTLRGLADLGVRLAIDDFGTGFSSLAYLAELPVTGVKLAPRFLRDLDGPLVADVIRLCHDLGITVTAEGVETEEQAAVLRRLSCDLAQGFRFARPVPASDITRMLG